MPRPYVNTPQTNDASYLSNGLDRLGEMSPEKSFFAPTQNRDLISQMRGARQGGAMNLKTPRAGGGRDPLRLLPNGNQGKAEFTPLMKSITKNNIARRLSSKKPGMPETPAYLRDGYVNGTTPGLPRMDENSHLQSEHTSSSVGNGNEDTPMPQHASSSAHSTPLVQLPTRDGGGVVHDGNMMTLREQENIIDKIEKENFGLKMKIHFLEEALSKRGSEFNQAALKENTDLKVNRITMQRELHKFKKNIAQAERDAEIYRLQLEEYKERIRRKQADESVRLELERLRSELKSKEAEVQEWQIKHDSVRSEDRSESEKLKDEIGDLQAELRHKDRLMDEKDDQIDALRMDASKESNVAAELDEELETAKQQIEDLKDGLERAAREAQQAKAEREAAIDQKRKAEEDLDELRDEMANKSFTTKGLSRQLEEKANKLEDDFHDLEERYVHLQAQLDAKSQSEKQWQDRAREREKDEAADVRRLQQELELAQQQRDTFERKYNTTRKTLETTEREVQVKAEEKDLLQTRHDALTTESAELQKDLAKARKTIHELENAVDEERHRAAQNDNTLRSQHKHEVNVLHEQIDALHREVNSKESDHAADLEEWEAQRRALEAAQEKAEERAKGLQRTVDKLQDAQGTVSGREMRVQEALESEKQRHEQEEKLLARQIEELQQDLAAKRSASEVNRSELSNAKEELRISIREQALLKEKVAELEEEIEVLQADIEQEHEFAEAQQKKALDNAEALMQRTQKEKLAVQEELASINIELQNTKTALKSAEIDRDELEMKWEKLHKSNDDTFNIDQEKRELKRFKQKLEKDVERLKAERDSLASANNALEEEINAEVERANAEENRLNHELDLLRAQQASKSEARDRELTSARNKVSRLEARIKDLEEALENRSHRISSPATDVSALRDDLNEAMKSEMAAVKRETELKAANRDLKIQIHDLERELHDAKLAQYKAAKSPSVSPCASPSNELARLRRDLVEARAELKEWHSQAREQKRVARRASADENVQEVDVPDPVKSSPAEVEELKAKVSEQGVIILDLRELLVRTRAERDEAKTLSVGIGSRDRQISHLQSQIRQLRDERDAVNDLSIRLSARDGEVQEMKDQLRHLREERSIAHQKAESVASELEILQTKYENMLERLTLGKSSADQVREKEMKGLIKEIVWLKAKCKREERLRKDLAWSKHYLEQGEVMRARCNQVDLRILREMGADVDKRKYDQKLRSRQKFRAGVWAVVAAIRISNMEEQWRNVRRIGDELHMLRSSSRQSKPRTMVRVREV